MRDLFFGLGIYTSGGPGGSFFEEGHVLLSSFPLLAGTRLLLLTMDFVRNTIQSEPLDVAGVHDRRAKTTPSTVARGTPKNVGDLEEVVGFGLKPELLRKHGVRIRDPLGGMGAECLQDPTASIDLHDVVAAPPSDPKPPLTHDDVEVVSAVQLSELLLGKRPPEERFCTLLGFPLFFRGLRVPCSNTLAKVLTPTVVVVVLPEMIQPTIEVMTAPAALILPKALVAQGVLLRCENPVKKRFG